MVRVGASVSVIVPSFNKVVYILTKEITFVNLVPEVLTDR
jgi:hypothetical protein